MTRYLSVCSGIEAASVAWGPLGWHPVAFSEIEAFPSAVLDHHYPETPNWGDMTQWKDWPDAEVDVLVGGTPCQSFSIAGLREGLDDPRGNLALTYLAIAERYNPRWIVWENVPGVLSSNEGWILVPSSGVWRNSGMGGPIESLTLNTCEHADLAGRSPREGDVSLLSDILETGDVPQRYYLTAKACEGILRRAARRGKELPEILRRALEAVARAEP